MELHEEPLHEASPHAYSKVVAGPPWLYREFETVPGKAATAIVTAPRGPEHYR
jgi:hypothetical protein